MVDNKIKNIRTVQYGTTLLNTKAEDVLVVNFIWHHKRSIIKTWY